MIKLNDNKLIIVFLLLCCRIVAGNIQAQEQGFRWGKWQQGQLYNGVGLQDQVYDSYVDSVGNTYIWGAYGPDARLGDNGPYICPLDEYGYDSQHVVGSDFPKGVFLAKIDSLGTVVWCKSAGASRDGLATPWNNMVVKDNKIVVALYVAWSSPWLYFFDTIFAFSGNQALLEHNYTYFVTFDMEGNMLEYHCVQLFGFGGHVARFFYSCQLHSSNGGNCFAIDNEDNIHIFTGGSWVIEDSLHKAYILVDEDTNRKYPLHPKTIDGEYLSMSLYLKLDIDWNLVNSRYLIDSLDGWTRCAESSPCLASIEPKKVIAKDDGIFAWCTFRCNDFRFEPDSLRVTAFLDSVHYLRIDNLGDFYLMPCLVKFNTDGYVLWVKQLYAASPPSVAVNYDSRGSIALDEDNVYFYCNPSDWFSLFLDRAHTREIVVHLTTFGLIVAYDRATGDIVDYYLVDTVNSNTSEKSFEIIGDEFVANVKFFYPGKDEILKINKYSKSVTRSLPIRYTRIGSMDMHCMSANSFGWIFRAESGEGPMVEDSIFIGNNQEALVLTFFYDSTLDLRRPRDCPAVDSLWCTGISGHSVSLSWRSHHNHQQYELAYVLQGENWDGATLIVEADTTTTITLPSDHCYHVRVRGLCDGNRRAHSSWSEPIVICPEAGIDEMELTARISLSPNPASGMVQVGGVEGSIVTVEILDLAGRQLQAFEKTSTLDISALPAGTYLAKIHTTQGSFTKKLVVQ